MHRSVRHLDQCVLFKITTTSRIQVLAAYRIPLQSLSVFHPVHFGGEMVQKIYTFQVDITPVGSKQT